MGNALAQDAHGRPPDPLELEFLESIFNTKKEKEGKENQTIHNQVVSSNQMFRKRGVPGNQKECVAQKLKSKIERIFKQTEKSRFQQWLQNFQQIQKNFPGFLTK